MTLVPSPPAAAPSLLTKLHRRVIQRGFIGTLCHLLDLVLAWLLSRLCRQPRGRSFGIREALAFGWRIDCWDRGTRLVDAITRLAGEAVRLESEGLDGESEATWVLDLGGGNAGLASFLPATRFRVVSVDVKRHLVRGARGLGVVADGCQLPFREAAFSVVASSDVLEHVPEESKARFLAEAARVAALGVAVHCPVTGESGRFDGAALDRRFQEWHVREFGEAEPNTEEHLAAGLPSVEQIRSALPGCAVEPTQPGQLWLDMVRLGRSRGKFLAGLRLMKRVRADDGAPPYHAALFTYRTPAAVGR